MFPRTGHTSAPSASSGCISAAFRGVQPWTVKFKSRRKRLVPVMVFKRGRVPAEGKHRRSGMLGRAASSRPIIPLQLHLITSAITYSALCHVSHWHSHPFFFIAPGSGVVWLLFSNALSTSSEFEFTLSKPTAGKLTRCASWAWTFFIPTRPWPGVVISH